MKNLTSTDIKQWAPTSDCKHNLPLLIRKLILAEVDIGNIKNIDFPYGEDVYVGGYDGILETETGNTFIPTGDSVWEFGVVVSGKGAKANYDYNLRKGNPLGKTPSETTYVGVTAEKYSKKRDWVEEKKEEGFWADVRYYDAIDIEQWLEMTPSIGVWLSRHLGRPVIGVHSADEYWEQWSSNGSMVIPTELLIGSRPKQTEELKTLFSQVQGGLRYVKSNTSEESLAYILATIEAQDDELRDSLRAKALVVENEDSFRQLVEANLSLILIPKFRIQPIDISNAVGKGHKIIIPISNSYSGTSNLMVLPVVRSETFRESLKAMGIDGAKAQLLSQNTGKDISVLRRTLEFPSKAPAWLNEIDVMQFLPFLLVARFDSRFEGDQEIISRITGSTFSEYESYLKTVLHTEETPLYNIGSTWRLISHSDAWLYLAKFLTQDHLDTFYKIAIEVLSETNPKYNLDPEKRYMASFYNANPKYSHYLKKGISETLVVLSVLSKKYGLNTSIDPVQFSNNVVSHILKLADTNLLRTQSQNLSLLAEASPGGFLLEVQNLIDDQRVQGFFEEEKHFLSTTNDLPHLLWALEQIAWIPEYLTTVVRILAQLIELAPELPTQNTPYNSLKSIFRLWYPQTKANVSERKQVLSILKTEYPDIAYTLFTSLINSGSDYAGVNPKMRWRLFSETSEVRVPPKDLYDMHGFVVDNLIELSSGNDIGKILALVNKIMDIYHHKTDEVLACIASFSASNEEEGAQIYHIFRDIIGRHRTYADADWALPEEALVKMEVVANGFKPNDIFLLESYQLENRHTYPMGGRSETEKKSYQEREVELDKQWGDVTQKIVEQHGIEKIIERAGTIDDVLPYARGLVEMTLSDEQESKIFNLILLENQKEKMLFYNYVVAKERKHGSEALFNDFEKLIVSGNYNDEQLGDFLIAMRTDIKLFKYVESLNNEAIEKFFWLKHNGWIPEDEATIKHAVEKFMKYGKPIAVMNAIGRSGRIETLATDYLVDTLDALDLSITNEEQHVRLDQYGMRDVFETIQQRGDVDEDKMVAIEFKFHFIFDSLGYGVSPKHLYKAIAKDPATFVELVKNCFPPNDEKLLKQEEALMTQEQRKNVFDSSYKILKNFNLIPGLDEEGNIDAEILNPWVDSVRELAKNFHREGIADSMIGEVLARYPNRKKDMFFPIEIYDVLERINNNRIKGGFQSQVFNRMGATSRTVDEGGTIERHRASIFDNLADEVKITHPNVADIFRGLAKGYERDAEDEDNDALHSILEY